MDRVAARALTALSPHKSQRVVGEAISLCDFQVGDLVLTRFLTAGEQHHGAKQGLPDERRELAAIDGVVTYRRPTTR